MHGTFFLAEVITTKDLSNELVIESAREDTWLLPGFMILFVFSEVLLPAAA